MPTIGELPPARFEPKFKFASSLSVAFPMATQPNGLMNLAYIGALFFAAAVLSPGVGLIRAARRMER